MLFVSLSLLAKAGKLAATKLCPVPGCHKTDARNDIKTSTHYQTRWRLG